MWNFHDPASPPSLAYPLAGTKGLSPWWEKTKLCTALRNRFFLSHRHSFMARSCKTAKCSMNTLGLVPCRWLCSSDWPEIQGEGKKTSLQCLSERWPLSSQSKAEPTVNKKKLKTAIWTAQSYRCGLGPERAKLNVSGVKSRATLTKKDRLAENMIWVALAQKSLFLSGKGTPCWPRCWTPPLGPAPGSLQRSLWIRLARGKELRQSESLVKHTMGVKGPVRAVTAQSHDLCTVTVLCSQINSKQAEKNAYDPDCCFAGEFRKMGGGGHKRSPTIKRCSVTRIYSVWSLEEIWTTPLKARVYYDIFNSTYLNL